MTALDFESFFCRTGEGFLICLICSDAANQQPDGLKTVSCLFFFAGFFQRTFMIFINLNKAFHSEYYKANYGLRKSVCEMCFPDRFKCFSSTDLCIYRTQFVPLLPAASSQVTDV